MSQIGRASHSATISATSSALRSVRRCTLTAGELAHPRQLAARVVARASLHPLDVAGEQLLEAERLARGRRCAGSVRPAHLVLGAGGDHRSTRASIRAYSRSRSITSPTSSVGCRTASRPQLAIRRPAARARRRRAARARARSAAGRWARSLPPPTAPAAASIACSACGPRRSSSAIQRSRTPSGGGGRRLSSVSAARRYRPVPPTTIGRRPVASSAVDLGVGELGVLAGAELRVDRQEREQPVLELRPLGRDWRRRSASRAPRRPAARRPRRRPAPRRSSRSRWASAIATSVLPTPVGPNRRDHLGARHRTEYRGAMSLGVAR